MASVPAAGEKSPDGAPEALEPEITPAMIAAGYEVVRLRDADLYEMTEPARMEEMLATIYAAMRRASRHHRRA